MSSIFSIAQLDAEIALRTEPLPTILWIELTSRCPFDCVFCSRQLLRGNGQHMDFAMYSRLIEELQDPKVIRLNYSGESIHYPRLVESCRAAADTGAMVELVTALVALPEAKLEPLVRSGLSNMTVSLHTLDPEQFLQIYGFGSIGAMKSHIERLQNLSHASPGGVELDFAFVAMQRNIDQLLPVVQYADHIGVKRVCVHPVIRRDAIRETFPQELEEGRLRPGFLALLQQCVEEARQRYPSVIIEVSTPELEHVTQLGNSPVYYPHSLPSGALIHGCDQDPWRTVHVLSDGRVVSCEVRDQIALGSLATASLRDIWHSAAYHAFRRQHIQGEDDKCRRCVYKRAYYPVAPPKVIIPGQVGAAGLLAGWHHEETNLVWSTGQSLLRLMSEQDEKLTIRLIMPPAHDGATRLSIDIDGLNVLCISHDRDSQRDVEFAYRVKNGGLVIVNLSVDRTYRPSSHSDTQDSRELGFALLEARVGRG